jgi:tRNA (guanine-N7-)-methyltransferase
MEIRVSVTQYVHDRIVALRQIQSMFPDTSASEEGSSQGVNNHPDVLAHLHDVKVREKLAAKAARKASRETEANKDTDVQAASETATVGPVETAEEETDRLAEERENERALKGKLDGGFKNVSVIRANAMKHLPNFFEKGQVSFVVGLFIRLKAHDRIYTVEQDILLVPRSAFQAKQAQGKDCHVSVREGSADSRC